ncbi:PEP-utilizing enzyme [Paraburkholderia sp. J12]|uniref:PEP-utilizing enzyme n=1 Tax=Paraburkholderia sp. J12 TaxID=2805432 RepID=UPI002ABE735E|nr:PEP-utilizing enzyme [Paraburkholderia sp. J12]
MTVVAEGFNAFETDKEPSGTVIYLHDPQSVVKLIQSGKLKDHILLVRGGTTTFLAPALSMGAIGVITMSGAPESHLGILSREFQIPCIMTAHLSNSASRYEVGNTGQAHFDEIVKELSGKKVTMKCTSSELGQVVV